MKIKKKPGLKHGVCQRCNKTNYVSETAAKTGMTFLWGADPGVVLGDAHVYPCPCKTGFYHIGHYSKFIPEKATNLLQPKYAG